MDEPLLQLLDALALGQFKQSFVDEQIDYEASSPLPANPPLPYTDPAETVQRVTAKHRRSCC